MVSFTNHSIIGVHTYIVGREYNSCAIVPPRLDLAFSELAPLQKYSTLSNHIIYHKIIVNYTIINGHHIIDIIIYRLVYK